MIVMPIEKGLKHYERSFGKFIYRYGYLEIPENSMYVTACVEEVKIRYKEETIKEHVQLYCSLCGIPDEWDPNDYGFTE